MAPILPPRSSTRALSSLVSRDLSAAMASSALILPCFSVAGVAIGVVCVVVATLPESWRFGVAGASSGGSFLAAAAAADAAATMSLVSNSKRLSFLLTCLSTTVDSSANSC